MGKTCFAPNCTSGYKSNPEKLSLFKAPTDVERLQKWRQSIPRADRKLTSKDSLCERHFEKHFITREWFAETNDGNVLMQQSRGWPKLSKEAVPTLFPGCPRYLSKRLKQPRKVNRRPSTAQSISSPSKSREKAIDVDVPEPAEPVLTNEQAQSNSPETMEEQDEFGELWINVDHIQLPNASWAKHTVEVQDIHSIIFNEAVVDENGFGITRKQLSWDSKYGVRAYIFNNVVDVTLLSSSSSSSSNTTEQSSVKKAEEILQAFDELRACEGGLKGTQFKGCEIQCAYIDQTGMWRHKKCSWLTLQKTSICKSCRNVENALRMHVIRSTQRLKKLRDNKESPA